MIAVVFGTAFGGKWFEYVLSKFGVGVLGEVRWLFVGAKLCRSPTPHPDWESRPRRPFVKFLGVGEGPHIP